MQLLLVKYLDSRVITVSPSVCAAAAACCCGAHWCQHLNGVGGGARRGRSHTTGVWLRLFLHETAQDEVSRGPRPEGISQNSLLGLGHPPHLPRRS
ncbi:hypothetical protein ElyMa_006995000 [Elysia marginata]|uniref:Secreted protein n=1 Tax=Elysia marginata TaxID=1093978 RepID=A0AAV4JMX9_9GAST|nr:hypothetical protein ElyMa_006995000 [Elysia marginata]